MADNYLEKKFEAYQERKAAAEKARRLAWRKRMDAYRKKLESERNTNALYEENIYSNIIESDDSVSLRDRQSD